MKKQVQDKATMEILKSYDVIMLSTKKNAIGKVGKELGRELHRIGVKPNEAETLFALLQERLTASEIEIGLMEGIYEEC